MWKNKKGISPLIATVLIIGFTVALAAVIMTWGQSFQSDISKGVQETTDKQLTCAQDVVVDISAACVKDANTLTLTIRNDGAKEIKKFSGRFYKDGTNVATDLATLDTLQQFGIYTKDVVLTAPLNGQAATTTLVELVPIIDIGGQEHTCATTFVTFGDKSYTDALAAC